MPPLSGEERMLTVFADVHAYFTEPVPKPVHHRFDKGSYLYIYHNAAQQKSRIEVANNPGTPDQDAFNGALDRIHICHSTRFPTLCTVTVDGPDPNPQAFPPPPDAASLYEWRLPSGDPRDQQTDLLRLHTLDIYFWTQDDANQVLDLMEHLLSPSQIETDRHPLPSESENNPNDNISTVVQQLENVAVADPAYQNGQTRNSQPEHFAVSNTTPEVQSYNGISTFAPPPAPQAAPAPAPAPAPGFSPAQQTPPFSPPPTQEQSAPLPYNPAAPAAPEPIQHREKTPPPVDAADGNGLAAAVAADNGIPYTPPTQTPGGFAPPPPPTTTQGQVLSYPIPGSYASPPPSAGLPPSSAPGLTHSGSLSSRSSSIQSPPGMIAGYAPSPSSPFFPGNVQQPLNRAGSISFAPPPQPQPQPQQQPQDPTANAHLYNIYQQQQQQQYLYQLQQLQQQQQQQQQQHQPQQAQQITPPAQTPTFAPPSIARNQTFPYDQTSKPASMQFNDPQTQAFAQQLQQQQQQQQAAAAANSNNNPANKPGKLENRATRMESGVNRFLKKLEKKL